MTDHHSFHGHLLGNLRYLVPHLLAPEQYLHGQVVQIFNGQADFLQKTPVIKPTWSKHCTKESTKQWSQPLSQSHLFSIYHQTAEAKGTACVMLILWWLNWPVMAASTMYSRLQLVYTTQTTRTGTRLYHTDYTYWYQVVPHRLHVPVSGCTTQTTPTGTRLYHTDYTYWYQAVPHRLHVPVPGCPTAGPVQQTE